MLIYGQASVGGTSIPPSVSSYDSYINSPVSIATGIPDISFPLMSLSTHKKDYNVSIGLSYHPSNIKGVEPASDVGSGWSLIYGGIISREIINGVDEIADSGIYNYSSNIISDDIYFYSLPSGSGKFKFEKKSDFNFELINLSASKMKIEFTGTARKNHYDCDSFKITDENGYQYEFNDYAISQKPLALYLNQKYRSAYYLNKVLSPSNQELVVYHNKDYSEIHDGVVSYRFYKPEIIESKDFGSINLVYVPDITDQTYNDPYKLISLILKDKKENIISQFSFDYSPAVHHFTNSDGFSQSIVKRTLSKFVKKDKYLNVIETTGFRYEESGYGDYGPIPEHYGISFLYDGIDNDVYGSNPKYLTKGLLKAVLPPTGGRIEYLFGANQTTYVEEINTIADKIENSWSINYPDIQYLVRLDSLHMDTNFPSSCSHNFTFTKPNTLYLRSEIKEYYPTTDPDFPSPSPAPTPSLKFRIKKVGSNAYLPLNIIEQNVSFSVMSFVVDAGSYTVEFYGTGGNADVEFYKIDHIPPPYKNTQTLLDSGVRIEAIKYYDQRDTSIKIPVRTVNYNYQLATDSNISSGVQFYSITDYPQPYINYTNVKVSGEDGKGFTRYYFKTLLDFPKIEIENTSTTAKYFYPNYNLVKNGVFDKKEVYNNNNQLVTDQITENIYENIEPQYKFYADSHWSHFTKASYLKSQKIMSNIYNQGNAISNIVEIINSSNNYTISYKKQTATDGNVKENNYLYALDRGNQNLIRANILNTPLEASSKLNNIPISKSETLFENPNNLFPTSSVSYAGNNHITGKVIFDFYDNNENLLQYTDQSGFSTAIIWGYSGTLPIAKIEGAKYADILSALGASDASGLYIVQKSDIDIDADSEQNLRNALETFRKKPDFKNYLITTYTYDPLIGVKSTTSPNGMTTYYFYDNANRLQRTEDVDHKILKEYKYHTNY